MNNSVAKDRPVVTKVIALNLPDVPEEEQERFDRDFVPRVGYRSFWDRVIHFFCFK